MKTIFGSRITFVIWHAFIGALLSFWVAHIANLMGWITWPSANVAFWICLIVGGLVGWYHHPLSHKEQ